MAIEIKSIEKMKALIEESKYSKTHLPTGNKKHPAYARRSKR